MSPLLLLVYHRQGVVKVVVGMIIIIIIIIITIINNIAVVVVVVTIIVAAMLVMVMRCCCCRCCCCCALLLLTMLVFVQFVNNSFDVGMAFGVKVKGHMKVVERHLSERQPPIGLAQQKEYSCLLTSGLLQLPQFINHTLKKNKNR